MTQKHRLSLLTVIALALPLFTQAASPWSVRLASTYLSTVDHSDLDLAVEDKLIPEFDVSYAFNDHWSADLVLTIPQEHEVKLNGGHIGSFKHLPPTLLAKYTINPTDSLRFYVGAGVNFTLIFDDHLSNDTIKLDNYSVGAAGQVGCDYVISEKWALNLDVKRMMLRTDVKSGGSTLTELKLDPWLFSLGLRYNF